jgi:uncharacterized protein
MLELYYLALFIALFSLIQSLFGVGILLFGTPTLLLLEYSYSETLWILVPCSVMISLSQVINDYKLIEAKKRAVYLVIPTLVLGLTFVILFASGINITKLVGVLLLLIGIVRFSNRLQFVIGKLVKKYIQTYYIIIGLVHGVSNMGGGPLTLMMTSIYSKKEIIRANVAFIYLILAIFQLVVLSIISSNNFRNEILWLVPISLLSYFLTKKFISSKVDDSRYAFILNLMVLLYGAFAIIK